jgi:hypothetical protein
MGTCPYQQPGNCAAFCIALPCLASPPRLARFGLIAFTAQFTSSPACEFLLPADNFRYILPSNPVPGFSPSSLFPYRATPTPEVLINALDTRCFLCILEKHPWPHISPSPPGWRQKDPRATPDPRGLFLPQNQSLCHVTGRAALAPSTLPGNAV